SLVRDHTEGPLHAAPGISGRARRDRGLDDKLTTTDKLVTTTDRLTPRQAVPSYCNFYEFGSAKSDAVQNAAAFKPKPWSVAVEGLCGKPGTYTLEDVLKPHALEERVYRMRCVEGWSMVIPWDGFPLGDFLKRFQPAANANYYGFYANVNPEVPTPSYSQATERRLGEFFMRRTLMFNGYADQVSSLYAGMNLRKFY